MAKRSAQTNWQPVVGSMLYPTAFGIALYFGVMTFVESSGNVLLIRYLAGHPVSKITTALTLIGFVALLLTAWRVIQQVRDSAEYPVPNRDSALTEDIVARSIALRDLIGGTSRKSLGHYRQQRLLSAARFVEQGGSADRLDDELKYLADVDAQRQADGYAFLRILIWAIPMLGFLGTVLGITQALGSIQVGPENDFQQMMNGLRAGLYVAFDTTAQALSFAIALMFIQFVVMRFETQLLEQVDGQVRRDLSGWFEVGATDGDVYVRTVQRIGRSILAAIHEMSQTQTEIWRRSIESAQTAWVVAMQENHSIVQRNLSDSIDSAVGRMADRLSDSIHQVDGALEHRGQQWQVHLSHLTRQIHEQQQAVVASSQAVLTTLRGSVPPRESETQKILDSVTLNRTLQDLVQTLNQFTSRIELRTSGETASDSAILNKSRAADNAQLRVFKEDVAA